MRSLATASGSSAAVPAPTATPTSARRALLVCGIASSVLYAAMNVFVPMLWEDYRWTSQTVSELSALGAPTRPLWVVLGVAYTLLVGAFGLGVWSSARRNGPLRVVGASMMASGIIGLAWPPMHQRFILAAGGGTLTDTLHIAWTIAWALLALLGMGFGMAALGRQFRLYTVVTIVILAAFGALTSVDGPRISADLPTPWVGVWERTNIASYLLWVVVLAITLLREPARSGRRRAAAPDERSLAGDDLLPAARAQVTHHIDIEAPPASVWPWLVQMGRRRGGWYSWDRLDNGGLPSADRILPELQALAVGDILPIKPKGPDGFAVLVLEPPRALVLGDPSLLPDRPRPSAAAPRATWAFSLEPLDDTATRLVVRVRAEYEPTLTIALLRPIIGAVHALMERKQLRTIKRRAEAKMATAA